MAEILLVEDDRAIARGLETNLEFEGHHVTHVLRGDTAIGEIRRVAPDLVVLDVMLPGLSGFEVCRQVRTADPHLPILMLTARGDEVDKAMGLDLGADDYLTKPFSLTEFLARVRALLRRASGRRPAPLPERLSFDDVSIDFTRFEVSRAGQAIHLTTKELALLRHLAAAGGAAVQRDTLLDRVWGPDVSVTTRTVDTHVLSIRQKLEHKPSEPRRLLTVHGVGYRFVSDVLTES